MNTQDASPRIGGWLLVPLAWLLMTLLTTALVMAMYLTPLFDTQWRATLFNHSSLVTTYWAISLFTATALWAYSMWVVWIFFKRSSRLPRHYIVWLLITVLLALKTFAFTPVSDARAIQTLLLSLAAAAVFVPYFKRSARVKATFTQR
ncbi:membrane protein [Pantoea ananatis]|uniref:DUF2569 domain-containing protein n=1 Tax=Pantoea ananas TaxID=553 RepID=UPI0007365E38|nr:DUF2569 domain-containing protein [Pantoea ananatis]KTR46335.1 membrane protein [Pantoea ananatis]KTR56534.1 membrane protein [Pantoea ananatis]KTR65908.1 membrane protein [Pantoea ananatis]KTR71410.1 membrane protein [Pantoea ananatis]PZD58923.1 DUF2569 domain-containing protein [Pantoea ananatis]